MPSVVSACLLTALGNGRKKLGQPVPLSNLVSDANSARAQPAQVNVPLRCSSLSGLLYGVSVASWRSTAYDWDDSFAFHCSSVSSNSKCSFGAAPAREQAAASAASPPPSSSWAPDTRAVRRAMGMAVFL